MPDGGKAVSLATFLAESGLEPDDIYAGNRSWTELKQAAGLSTELAGPKEKTLLRGCGRMLHADDLRRLRAYRKILQQTDGGNAASLPTGDRRLVQMLVASVADKAVTKGTSLIDGLALLRAHANVRDELLAILDVLENSISHTTQRLASHPEVPLEIHARYSRLEILAAFGLRDSAKMPPWQSGVYWAKTSQTDLLAFTLDKTSGGFSPTTRYRDYAVSRDLIHWESQSVTRADSPTGQRYQHHAQQGSWIMLFARLNTDDRAFWFLGPATYVKHEGEQPMSITWRLAHPLPADLYTTFAAAVA